MPSSDGKGYLLPSDPLPEADDDVCFAVFCPNDANYKRALLGQVTQLGKWFTWERDPDHRAVAVAERYKAALAKTETNWFSGDGCFASASVPSTSFSNSWDFTDIDDCEYWNYDADIPHPGPDTLGLPTISYQHADQYYWREVRLTHTFGPCWVMEYQLEYLLALVLSTEMSDRWVDVRLLPGVQDRTALPRPDNDFISTGGQRFQSFYTAQARYCTGIQIWMKLGQQYQNHDLVDLQTGWLQNFVLTVRADADPF